MTYKTTSANDSIHNSEQGPQDGLTKREYFAAMAMQGLLAGATTMAPLDKLGQQSVAAADAVIAELNKE